MQNSENMPKPISNKRISVIVDTTRSFQGVSGKNINTRQSIRIANTRQSIRLGTNPSQSNSSVFELLENVKKEMSQAHKKEWYDPSMIPSIENLFAGLDEQNTMDKKEILS